MADKIVMSGFLEYVERMDGWEDSIRLVDGGAPGKAGIIPLVMDRLKPLNGKEVRITVETL